MAFSWEDKDLDVIVSYSCRYTFKNKDYEEIYTYEVSGKCAFFTLNRISNAVFCTPFSKNANKINLVVSRTQKNLTDGTESTTTNENTYTLTRLTYAQADTGVESSVPEGSVGECQTFSRVLSNLANKWNATFGTNGVCYYYDLGNSGGIFSTIASNAYKSATGLNPTHTNISESCTVLDLTEDCPIYLENRIWNEELFNSFANNFTLVNTYMPVKFSDRTGYINNKQRRYVLMNLLDNPSKWEDGTREKEWRGGIDIFVNMDGTVKPNCNISWKPKARYGDDTNYSNYSFDIYSMGSGGENKISIGSFPLDFTDTVTFSNKEMQAGRTHSGNYIQIAFNSNWKSTDWWVATVFDNMKDFSENYNKLSSPNNLPELHITVNQKRQDDDGDGDNEDDGDGGKDDESGGTGGSGVNPHSLLTTTYVMTPARIQQIGSVLWESSFLDNILLVNNSPIENILSVKMFPFNFPSGSDSEVKIGNVKMGVNGQLLPNSYNYRHDLGNVSVTKLYNSFLDFSPYTRLMLYLPYYGVTELDCSVYMGRSLSISYIIDVVVGSCLINVYANGILTNQYSSQVGVDIPITSSNRASVEASIVSSALKSVVTADISGFANTLIDGGLAKYHTQTSGSPSSACGMYAYKNPMIIIDRPNYSEITGYAHSYGKTCLQQKTIKNVKGYTEMSENIELKNIPCTVAELEEIKNILTTGFYA